MASDMVLPVVRCRESACLPHRATADAAGADLHAAVRTVVPGGSAGTIVPTGLKLAIPRGYMGLIAPRSGLAVRAGVGVNGGIIDADYRGELGVILTNCAAGATDFVAEVGERIAQLIIMPVAAATFMEAEAGVLEDTARGASGFGSTGTA